MLMAIDFEVIAQEGEARAGLLTTRRGVIETPVFMPVGTAGTVKGIRFEELESPDLDARIILGNTYHLWLRPGIETIKACGGLHKFIGWNRPMLTDSGGFQVWSLGALRKSRSRELSFDRTSTVPSVFSRQRFRCRCSRCSALRSPWPSMNARRVKLLTKKREAAWS